MALKVKKTITPTTIKATGRSQTRLATMYDNTRCPLVSAALLLGNSAFRPVDSSAGFGLIVGFLATSDQLLPVEKAGCEHCHPTTYRTKNQSFDPSFEDKYLPSKTSSTREEKQTFRFNRSRNCIP